MLLWAHLSEFLAPTCLPGLLTPYPGSGLGTGSVWTQLPHGDPCALDCQPSAVTCISNRDLPPASPSWTLREAYSLTSSSVPSISWLQKDLGPRIRKLESYWGIKTASLALLLSFAVCLLSFLSLHFSFLSGNQLSLLLHWHGGVGPGATEAPTFSTITQLVSYCRNPRERPQSIIAQTWLPTPSRWKKKVLWPSRHQRKKQDSKLESSGLTLIRRCI